MILKLVCDVAKVLAFASCLLMGLPVSRSLADGLPSGEYDLVLPRVQEKASDYDSDIQRYRVNLQDKGAIQYLIPKSEHVDWFVASRPLMNHALMMHSKVRNEVLITGFWRKGEGILRVDLSGTIQENKVTGSGTLSLGTDPQLKNFPMVYRIHWGLFPANGNDASEVSTRVKYEGAPPRVVKVQVGSYEDVLEDLQSKPPMSALAIKALSYEVPDARKHRIERLSKAEKTYLENLLSEITWAEIKVAPGIILLVDHLATLDESVQQNVAKAYVRDGTSDYLEGLSYKALMNCPTPLLLVHCYPKLDKNAKAKLKNASRRFESILVETEKVGALSPNAPEDVLLGMSKEERDKFFATSQKLQSFIKRSQNGKLKALLP